MRLLHGAGMGCSAPVALSLVSESLPQDRLAGGVGVYTISQAVAMAVGPAFGIWMSREVGYAAVFGVTAVSLAVSFTLVCLMVRERANAERPPYQLKLSRAFCARATGLTCVLGLMAAAYACTSSFLAIYGGLRGVEQIGLYFTVYALCLVATRPLFGRLADTFGTARVLVPALLCFMASYLLVSRASGLAGFLLAAVVAACGFGVCVPLVQALVFKCVPASQRGSASNTCYVGMDVGNLVGPYLAGHAVEAMAAHGIPQVEAYANMWVLLVVPVALALVLFLALRPRVARYVREASA